MNKLNLYKNKGLNNYFEILIIILVSVNPVITLNFQIVLCAILLLFNIHYFKFQPKFTAVLFVCFLLPAVHDLIQNDTCPYSFTYVAFPLFYICGYIIAQKYSLEDFMQKFEKVVFYLAILSLIGYSLIFIAPAFIYKLPTYEMNDSVHHTIYFFNFLFVDDYCVQRNSGITWEPGIFQMFLNISLLITFKSKEQKYKTLRILVYVIALFFTKSTMGYLLFVFVLCSMLKQNKKYIFLLIIITFMYVPVLEEQLTYQLSYKAIGSDSFDSRLLPMVNAYAISYTEILGIGSSYYNEFFKILNIGSFDSYSQILMRYGYPLFVYFLYKVFKLFKYDFYLGIIIFLTLFSEPIWSTILISTILFLNEKTEKQDR